MTSYLPIASTYESRNLGSTVTVTSRHGLDEADFSRAERAIATSDGRALETGVGGALLWHRGPESPEAIYFEVLVPGGVVQHGFADSASRRVVQVG